MRIALLGGSFDPPHKGHLLLAEQIRRLLPIDEVWLIPCYKHPFGKQLSPEKHRLTMTRLLENTLIKVSDVEITKKDISYSIDTLRLLQQLYPSHSFFFIIGSDQIRDFPKWKEWQAIINEFGLVIYPRNIDTTTIPALVKQTFHMHTIPKTVLYPKETLQTSRISSTEIRTRIKNNQSITGLVTPAVAAYIMKQRLYE